MNNLGNFLSKDAQDKLGYNVEIENKKLAALKLKEKQERKLAIKEERLKNRNKKIGIQFGNLINGARTIRKAHVKFIQGRLHEIKFEDDNFCFMPTIENGRVLMVYMGNKYSEYTVDEFINKFKV